MPGFEGLWIGNRQSPTPSGYRPSLRHELGWISLAEGTNASLELRLWCWVRTASR
jgi:hypothetical protein